MARMGDWRNDNHEEIELDGIGGVNILVKADVHRSGTAPRRRAGIVTVANLRDRHQLPLLRLREPG